MAKILGLTGDEAVAWAAKICDVDVVAAYPITPQTIMVERFSDFVANGEVKTEFVCVESEHSAMSACVGSSLTGARVFSATSSQGLALMHEMLYLASSLRCPIVMGVANRALSAPINIHCDHSDTMGSRDCGWIQIYTENAQEAYDTVIEAFKIAEDPGVLLPVMVNLDGFIVTHCFEGVRLLEDEEVKKFLPQRKLGYILDPKNPITIGAFALTDYYFEIKRQQEEAIRNSLPVIIDVEKQFKNIVGRGYEIIQTYKMEDAEVAIVCLGSTAGTTRDAVDELRKEGEKVGAIKIRLYRPFPTQKFLEIVKNVKVLTILDRTLSFGAPSGPLFSDINTVLYSQNSRPLLFNVIYGLGGRDMPKSELEIIFREALKIVSMKKIEHPIIFSGLRE